MEETQVSIFPVFPHVIKGRFTAITLTFLEDKFICETHEARREMLYSEITWIELKALLEHRGKGFLSFLKISQGGKGYHAVGKEPIHLEWSLYNTEQRSEIVKILRTQAPQAQYNDLALQAFRYWF